MAKCFKCGKVLGKRSPGVQCSKCSKWIHGSCASLTTEQLSALSTTESVDWKCRNCSITAGGKPKRISVILPDPDDEESDMESVNHAKQESILHEIRQEVREMRKAVRDIIQQELQNTLKFYSEKIDDFEETVQKYDTRIKLLENQCKNLNNKCSNLELKNDVLEQKINKLEQAHVANEVEVCGIPMAQKEDVQQVALKVCHILKQEPNDILKVYRKKLPHRPGAAQAARALADSPIIIALRNGCREAWTSASKTANILTRDLGLDGESKVYVRDMLTPATAFLLWKTKDELKSTCRYVWCKQGVIMVRKNEGDKKIFYIRSAKDIDIIKKELIK